MGGRRIALVLIGALAALGWSGGALAQPADSGGIATVPEQAGSGSAAGNGRAAGNRAEDGAPSAASPPESPVKDPKLAKEWLVAGQLLMHKGSLLAAKKRLEEAKAQFENALTAFQTAIEAGDDVNVYFDLANAEDRLGKLVDAVKHLRLVVNTKAGGRPDIVKRATTRLEDLSTRVGIVTLTVIPAGSSITLGGAELGTSPLPGPLVLMPGTYTLSFHADGFHPMEAEIKIEPGSESERAVALEPVKVIVQPVKPPVLAKVLHEREPRPPSKLPLYAGAGVACAAVLGTGIFGIVAVSQHSTFKAASTSKLDREDARTSGQRFALITDLTLGTAAAAAGFTAYWYFYRYKRAPQKLPNLENRHPPPVAPTEEDSRPADKAVGGFSPRVSTSLTEAKLDVVPWVQPQSGGVTIAGRF
jgi:hypothetical protein